MALPLKSVLDFQVTGHNNMTGETNSLWSRIKMCAPNCIKMQCTCHSLALCIQKGFDKLPSNLGCMLLEVPKWFRKSTLRRENFKMLFDTMNTRDERQGTPLPFITLSATRWLVRGKVIFNILVNWLELRAYFQCASVQWSQEVRYKARTLWEMFSDDSIYLYFVFCSRIVTEIERVNAFFQSTNVSPSQLLHELDMHFKSLNRRVYIEDGLLLPVNMTDSGAKFSMECTRTLSGEQERLLTLQKPCQDMRVELVAQVKMRLPKNRSLFDSLCKLSPANILTHINRPTITDLPFSFLMEGSLEACEEQYRRILYHPWNNEEIFSSGIPDDLVQFWSAVKKIRGRRQKTLSGAC